MWVIAKYLRPGLEYAHKSDVSPEEALILCQSHNGFCRCLEEEMVHGFLMTSEYRSQALRHRDGCHEVRNRQQYCKLFFHPLINTIILAFWAMSVPTRMIAVMDLIAILAEVFLSTHHGSSAGLDMPHHPLMRRQNRF